LKQYWQDAVTVLRQACEVFRREFKQTGNIDVFLESITIASACNKVLRKRFVQPNTISRPCNGLQPMTKLSNINVNHCIPEMSAFNMDHFSRLSV
jgi:hypothetical protein